MNKKDTFGVTIRFPKNVFEGIKNMATTKRISLNSFVVNVMENEVKSSSNDVVERITRLERELNFWRNK